jgi:hypothetical protein
MTSQGGAVDLYFYTATGSLDVDACQFIADQALGGAGGQGYGGALSISSASPSGGSAHIAKNTLFVNNLASTGFNDIDGTYTVGP